MVWELDGPMPILNISKTLTVAALKRLISSIALPETRPNGAPARGGKYTRYACTAM
jgi:hypothetical protein